MLAHSRGTRLRTRFARLIAGAIGFVGCLLALLLVAFPASKFLTQFAVYSPIERISIVVKLLSPLLCFVLVGGWAWVLLSIGDSVLSRREMDARGLPQLSRTAQARAKSPPDSADKQTPPQIHAEQPLTVSPLSKLDSTYLSSIARPNPLLAPSQDGLIKEHEEPSQDGSDEHKSQQSDDEYAQETSPQPSLRQAIGYTSPLEQKEAAFPLVTAQAAPFLLDTPRLTQTATPIAISLLKQVRVQILSPDGSATEVKLRRGERAIRLIVLAYIAWRRGAPVDRDKLLEHLLARGRRKDYTVEQLGEAFDSMKKFLREDLKRAVQALHQEAGREVIAPTVDFFSAEPGFCMLHSSCCVRDLDTLEHYHQVIEQARKEGHLDEKLDGSLPPRVVDACQSLLRAYPGDFLEDLLDKFPGEFGAWVREPLTRYRDYYLEALWILARHESAIGQNFADERLAPEQNAEQRRHYQAKAAQRYVDYAMDAIKTRWDHKVKFASKAGKDGERVVMSERAMRRAVVLFGLIGKTELMNQAYLTYKERMATLSKGQWKPDPQTEELVATAKKHMQVSHPPYHLPSAEE
jgi:hypothetical protein